MPPVLKSESETVLFSRPDPFIAVLTLNRPEQLNAVNVEMAHALARYAHMVETDPQIRVVVLAGAGDRAFCAGADLKDIAAGRIDEIVFEEGGLAGFVAGRRSKPWIAEVGGIAYGGGMEFLLACDLVVASDTAHFSLPEVKRGRIARGGGAIRLASRIPRVMAIEMLATGEPIDATRAFELGLINRMVPCAILREETMRLARAISANAPLAVQESIALARQVHEADETGLWALNAAAYERVIKTEDSREGTRAFVEKRPPVWRGR